MKINHRILLGLFTVSLLILVLNCGGGISTSNEPYDTNTEVPKGDPPFPPLDTSWVIDQTGLLSSKTVKSCDAILENLNQDGVAQVVVLIKTGIKQPETYAMHYGRWLKLGKKGLSTEGGNNGLVWLIRPDADQKITVEVGRGLPKFVVVGDNSYGSIIDSIKEYIYFGNYNQGVKVLVQMTDSVLRTLYRPQQ